MSTRVYDIFNNKYGNITFQGDLITMIIWDNGDREIYWELPPNIRKVST